MVKLLLMDESVFYEPTPNYAVFLSTLEEWETKTEAQRLQRVREIQAKTNSPVCVKP